MSDYHWKPGATWASASPVVGAPVHEGADELPAVRTGRGGTAASRAGLERTARKRAGRDYAAGRLE